MREKKAFPLKKKYDDKEAAEEVRKRAMERMGAKNKSSESSAAGSAKKADEVGAMRLNSWKKRLRMSIPFACKS